MISSAELTLGMALSQSSLIETQLDGIMKVEQYLKSLEDERKKIEAFQRELPLCMKLLNDEIQTHKDRLAGCHLPIFKPQSALNFAPERGPNLERKFAFPVLEEFIPLKKTAKEVSSEELNEGKESMITNFQKGIEANILRQSDINSQELNDMPHKRTESVHMAKEDIEIPKPILSSQGRKGGAFLPFSGVRKPLSVKLSEFSTQFGDGDLNPCAYTSRTSSITDDMKNKSVKETQLPSGAPHIPGQPQRKPRRCWSPELHRRFVNALQQLGGSEAATPKQIRELMKVDGLTNDEVKSHLQKYRLHTRRPNAAFHPAAPHAPQLVVLGGIWVPPTAATGASPKNNLLEHQVSHLQSPSFSKDHYAHLNPTNQMQIHPGFSVAPHSQDSSQAKLLSIRRSCDDESLGDDGNDTSSWRADYENDMSHEANAQSYERSNSKMCGWRYSNESGADDDSEAEDGRVYETPT